MPQGQHRQLSQSRLLNHILFCFCNTPHSSSGFSGSSAEQLSTCCQQTTSTAHLCHHHSPCSRSSRQNLPSFALDLACTIVSALQDPSHIPQHHTLFFHCLHSFSISSPLHLLSTKLPFTVCHRLSLDRLRHILQHTMTTHACWQTQIHTDRHTQTDTHKQTHTHTAGLPTCA